VKLDREWFISQAGDTYTADKINEIVKWQEAVLASNCFTEGDESFFLSLGKLRLRYQPFSAVASLEIYQEMFRDDDHRKLSDFIGKEAEVVLDVGANQGLYALRAKLENPGCRVYCFEPNPLEYASLVENIALNGMEGITVFHAAVGESDKDIVFEYVPGAGAISGKGVRTVERQWMREEFIARCSVKQVSLDAFCASHQIRQVDILKIDTEGMEMEVLSGSSVILANCDRVVIERHSSGLRHEVVRCMENAGFDLVYEDDALLERYYADLYFRNRNIRSK